MKKRGKRRVSGFAKGAISESETGVDSSNFGWKTGNEGMICLSTQGKEEKKSRATMFAGGYSNVEENRE